MHPRAQLASGLQTVLHRSATQPELDAFSRYLDLLLRWNRVHSLTAYRDPHEIVDKLFLDSLLFLEFLPPRIFRLLDLGSGAGIPGIPLKIVRPAYVLTLIEARRRRATFLTTVVRELALPNVQVLTGRAESLIKEHPNLEGGFDAVVTRASGSLDRIAPLALKFLRPGGEFVASGPPITKPASIPTELGSWEVVRSPLSGLQRRFLLIKK